MNTTVISGRLVRNPGYNEVENEKGLHKIAKFVLAVRRNYSDEVSFIPVKAFAKKAEFGIGINLFYPLIRKMRIQKSVQLGKFFFRLCISAFYLPGCLIQNKHIGLVPFQNHPWMPVFADLPLFFQR